MAGYSRQSAADIVPTAVVRATPLNNEFNALRDTFAVATGHTHDGSATEGGFVPAIADPNNRTKVVIDTANSRISMFVNIGGTAVEQLRVVDGAIVPVTDDDIDLGSSGAQFKNLYIDGTANIDSLVADTADINGGTIDGTVIGATTPAAATVTTFTVNTSAVIASADINAGTIDGVVIGGASAQAITGTLVTASTGFVGGLTGAVTGNVGGNLTGNVTGNVAGNLTGNVTASSGTSSFNDVTINGGLNMNAGTSATITNLTSPTSSGDAATKGYVDTADALKLALAGGTMSGALAMGTSKITGLGDPTANQDAATKVYVDTSIANVIDAAPAALDTLNELAAALGDDANFSTTVTNSIAAKLPLAGGTLSGALAMGTSKITGVGNPTLAQDAATKTYVDTADALKLPLAGGTMSGAIALGTNKITGLGDPTANQDAATKTYVDTADAANLSLTGGTMSGAIALGTNKITGLGDPTANQDAATKNYIDVLFGSTTSAANSAATATTRAGEAATSAGEASASATQASNSATTASDAATAAADSYDAFDDRYLGSKSASPSVDNDGNALLTGALYWDTTASQMRVYTGNSWVATGSAVNGTTSREVYTANSSQTTFAVVYDAGYVDVYLNGVKLVAGTDFTATSGTNIVLATAATDGDIVDIVAYGAFALADVYTKAASDARYATAAQGAGTGVTSTYVSSVAVGGTTFAQPAVTGEINSDEGFVQVNYAGATGITVATLTSASTYVYIDKNGALQQQVTEPTRQDWSRKMFTMRIAVNTATNLILGFEYLNNPIGRYANSIRDVYSFLLSNGVPFKKDQTVTGRAGDLGFDVSAGTLLEFGGTGDIYDPNILSFSSVANATFFLSTRTGFDAGGNTNLPKFWDNAGTLTALGSTTVVGHRLYRFSNGNFVMQYGQGNYANMTLAKSGALLEDYILNPALANATFFGWWFIESTATNTAGTTLTAFKEYTIGVGGGISSALSGALLQGNNLSDVLDAATARTNLSVVGITDTQTLTNKTITGVVETKVAMAAHAIDLSLGNYFTYTLSGAQTLTVSNIAASGSVSAFVLEVTNGGSAALSYFSGVTWAAATAPTLTAAGVDTLAFFTSDGGTTWRAFVLGLGMA